MIVDSHAIGRNGTKGSCTPVTQFPPVVMSSKTIVQYHNQKIDIDILHSPYSDFIILHEFICVFSSIQLYHVFRSDGHQHNQDTKVSCLRRIGIGIFVCLVHGYIPMVWHIVSSQ